MGSVFSFFSSGSVFPGLKNLEVVRGPDQDGCYYIMETTFSKISLRYRFTANMWEWKAPGGVWSSIPSDLSDLYLNITTTAALACLRDSNPPVAFERHIQHIYPLGEGAFGKVYKVKFKLIMGHERFLPAYTALAMKTINTDESTYTPDVWMELALENEITLLKEVQHPCIVRFYQCILYKEQIAMVTELCTGGTAESLRKQTKGIIPEDTILTMMSHCLQALHVLHAKNIVHRDIKPDNVFISKDSQNKLIFKLGDFGLAKVKSNSSTLMSNRGNMFFHAPEVIKAGWSSLPAMSTKSDIWAIGVTVYFMCTNALPFTEKNMHTEFRTHAPFQRVNNVVGSQAFGSDVQAFLDACLQKDWQTRSSAQELVNTFQRIILQYPPGDYC